MLALGRLDFAALLAGPTARRRSGCGASSRGSSPSASAARSSTSPASLGGGAPGPAARPDAEPLRRSSSRRRRPTAATSAGWPRSTTSTRSRSGASSPRGATSAARRVGRSLEEGAPSPAYYLTINGAVEKVLVRGDRRIRVGLAGPGKAFGYEGLIDGRPSQVTAIARERALLLVVPRELFGRLFAGEDAVSRGFLAVIQNDLMATLRETLRPAARLAASG